MMMGMTGLSIGCRSVYKFVMSIIYSLVARQQKEDFVNICSHDVCSGNYPAIIEGFLRNFTAVGRHTYNSNGYNIHTLLKTPFLYICLSDGALKIQTANAFFEKLERKFHEKFPAERILNAKTQELSLPFQEAYRSLVGNFNSGKEMEKIDILLNQLKKVHQTLNENTAKVIRREEKINVTMQKTGNIDNIADIAKRNAVKIKRDTFLNKHKCKILVGSLLLASLTGFILII